MAEGLNRIGGTMACHRALLKKDPNYKQRRLEIEKFTQSEIKKQGGKTLRRQITRIPVVVHVLYNTPEQNISDEQIHSQIDVLNHDFRKLNSDINLVPPPFQSRAADAFIEFQLATKDPNSNHTTGITRTQTNVEEFSYDGETNSQPAKFSSQGGHDAWPRDNYLNTWVCKLARGLLGYAQFPGGPADTDGVAVTYEGFGTNGTAKSPFDKGRTSTHEIGHWLNLNHIWGDDGGGCSRSDNVADTPNQADSNGQCPTFPHVTCNNGPDGDMFMNYMDYTNDACMYMFTQGQVARMQAALNGPRSSLIDSEGATTPDTDTKSQVVPEKLGAEFEEGVTELFDGATWVPREQCKF
jgi:hypothetical protein